MMLFGLPGRRKQQQRQSKNQNQLLSLLLLFWYFVLLVLFLKVVVVVECKEAAQQPTANHHHGRLIALFHQQQQQNQDRQQPREQQQEKEKAEEEEEELQKQHQRRRRVRRVIHRSNEKKERTSSSKTTTTTTIEEYFDYYLPLSPQEQEQQIEQQQQQEQKEKQFDDHYNHLQSKQDQTQQGQGQGQGQRQRQRRRLLQEEEKDDYSMGRALLEEFVSELFFYVPATDVYSYAVIDLDFKELIEELSEPLSSLEESMQYHSNSNSMEEENWNPRMDYILNAFENAYELYKYGKHCEPYAVLTLEEPLEYRIPPGTEVIGGRMEGNNHNPIVGATVIDECFPGTIELQVQYPIPLTSSRHTSPTSLTSTITSSNLCQVGGSSLPNFLGCFQSRGTIAQLGPNTNMVYSYDLGNDNRNFITLQTVSKNICTISDLEHCRHFDYIKYYNYYGTLNYADQWIQASFPSNIIQSHHQQQQQQQDQDDQDDTMRPRNIVDFSKYATDIDWYSSNNNNNNNNNWDTLQYQLDVWKAHAGMIQTSIVALSLHMKIITTLEDAIQTCQQIMVCIPNTYNDVVHDNESACDEHEYKKLHFWDQAVAYYIGSLPPTVRQEQKEDNLIQEFLTSNQQGATVEHATTTTTTTTTGAGAGAGAGDDDGDGADGDGTTNAAAAAAADGNDAADDLADVTDDDCDDCTRRRNMNELTGTSGADTSSTNSDNNDTDNMNNDNNQNNVNGISGATSSNILGNLANPQIEDLPGDNIPVPFNGNNNNNNKNNNNFISKHYTNHDGGYLLFSLANQRCLDFNTCDAVDYYTTTTTTAGITGTNANDNTEEEEVITSKMIAKVNNDIFDQFKFGQNNLIYGSCNDAAINQKRIVSLLTIPIIQSVLYYAYQLAELSSSSSSLSSSSSDKNHRLSIQAIGASFAASIVPMLRICSADDADRLYEKMMVPFMNPTATTSTTTASPSTFTTTDFILIKQALERNYRCLGITCRDIGGILDTTLSNNITSTFYKPNAHPCTSEDDDDDDDNINNTNNNSKDDQNQAGTIDTPPTTTTNTNNGTPVSTTTSSTTNDLQQKQQQKETDAIHPEGHHYSHHHKKATKQQTRLILVITFGTCLLVGAVCMTLLCCFTWQEPDDEATFLNHPGESMSTTTDNYHDNANLNTTRNHNSNNNAPEEDELEEEDGNPIV